MAWNAYSKLAWVEAILDPPRKDHPQTMHLVQLLKKHNKSAKTVLTMACGAGIMDYALKTHYTVSGLDVSEGMLSEARALNPEIPYYNADMTNAALPDTFDAVIIHEVTPYLHSKQAISAMLDTAQRHLNEGGVVIMDVLSEQHYSDNTFIYEGSNDTHSVTLFENNKIQGSGRYEATMV